MVLVGVDVGGTFTDLVIHDDESGRTPAIIKVPTSTKQPDKAIVTALAQYGQRERITLVSHATTIATNALLTRAGLARTALITNRGFRDVLEIGRQRRPEVYNLKTKRPVMLVERKSRFTVKERTLSDGSILEPLSQKDLRAAARKIFKARYASVAIGFLNSYTNPKNERKAEQILRESGFKGHIDRSSGIDPQYREYERISTTIVNATLAPLISRYLIKLWKGLEQLGVRCPVYVMKSDATASTLRHASTHPISMIESGPAAGVLSSKRLAEHLSLKRVITFDMGGTTAKAGIIIETRPELAYEFEAAARTYHGRSIKGGGYPVRQPFIDLAEVSAGGGTIAWIDETGSLRVGPASAGADPGPAAYGKGGRLATVTDANIIAGRINPTQLLGGRLKVYHDLSLKAIRQLGRKLGVSVEKTAENILRIVNDNMSKALSLVSIERGRDPREHTLIAFGGAGPLHACDLAEELRIKRIIIPQHPGLFSAFGLLTASLSRSFSQPILRSATRSLEPDFLQLRKQTRKALKQEGYTTYSTTEQVDLRYQGQAYEITVPYNKNTRLGDLFGREHRKLYGYSSDDLVEAVNARLTAVIPTPTADFPKRKPRASSPPPPVSSRRVSLLGDWQTVPVYNRESLRPGVRGEGPCVVEEYDSTTMVGREWEWRVDAYEDIDLRCTSDHVNVTIERSLRPS